MTDASTDTAAQTAVRPSAEYDPFNPKNAYNPPQQYWADRAFWAMHKASVSFAEERERNRCREIVQKYLQIAPESVRLEIRNLLNHIQFPGSEEN
jgi:hypothetical protein